MALVATLEELKKHLNRPTAASSDDAELTDTLTAASELVEKITGDQLAVDTYTERYDEAGSLLVPRRQPLASVTSITPDYGPAVQPTRYVADIDTGTITLRWGWWGCGTLVYAAGLSTIPYRYKLAGLIITAHLWETQRGAGRRAGDDDGWTPSMGYAIPRRAQELLADDPPVLIA